MSEDKYKEYKVKVTFADGTVREVTLKEYLDENPEFAERLKDLQTLSHDIKEGGIPTYQETSEAMRTHMDDLYKRGIMSHEKDEQIFQIMANNSGEPFTYTDPVTGEEKTVYPANFDILAGFTDEEINQLNEAGLRGEDDIANGRVTPIDEVVEKVMQRLKARHAKLFIDDLRFPVDNTWNIARTSQEAIDFIKLNGLPGTISFDHDLGGDDTAIVVINWMIDQILDGKLIIPKNFTYTVHSANPVGKANIIGKMEGIIKHLKT